MPEIPAGLNKNYFRMAAYLRSRPDGTIVLTHAPKPDPRLDLIACHPDSAGKRTRRIIYFSEQQQYYPENHFLRKEPDRR